jgi:hypothetical protein
VLVVHDLAASGRDRDDFTTEGIARSRPALLADEGEAILFRAVDFQEVGDAFGGLPHSDAEHGISETVGRDRVDQGAVTQFAAEAESRGVMRGAAHHLDAAGQHEPGLTRSHGIGGEAHRLETRCAHHVDGVGGGGLGQSETEPHLTGHVHAASCREHLADDHLGDIRAEGFGDDCRSHGQGKIGGTHGLECTPESPDG